MARRALGRSFEGGPQDDFLEGTGRSDVLFGAGGNDTIVGGRGVDLLFGGSGSDVFVFDDGHAGDMSFGRADTVGDFSSEDALDLSRTEVRYFAGYDVVSPDRGGFSIWEARGDTYVTWNTFGKFHDVKLADFQGDYDELFSQIRWYDDDYLASTATSGVIGAGETVTGEIEIAGDEDWFRVEIDAGQLYTFELEEADESGTIYDPYLVLYDAFGDYLTEGYGALSYFADTTDTFFVSVGAYDGTGSYALTATAAPYTDDFGDDPSTTGEIAAGETVTGEIGVPYDQDWFRVEIEEGLLYEFGLEGVGENGEALLDPYLALYDPSGEFVIDGYEALSFLGDTTGTYFIAAESYGETGSYSLSLTAGPYVDDFGNEPSTAGEIAVGEMATGVIGVFYDEDWFRIDLVENETYAIDLRGQSSGSGTLPDPYLSLLDAEGSELAFNDDTNDLDSQIVFTPDASAIYYLAARELSSGTGTFELEVFVYEGDILIG